MSEAALQMKWTVDELIEAALIYAIQDREEFWASCHDDDVYGKQAKAMAEAFRKYHRKRFKRQYLNELERMCAEAETITLEDLRKQKIAGEAS